MDSLFRVLFPKVMITSDPEVLMKGCIYSGTCTKLEEWRRRGSAAFSSVRVHDMASVPVGIVLYRHPL